MIHSDKVESEVLARAFQHILEVIGEDLEREGLVDTPRRAAKAFRFLTKGYEQNIEEVINGAVFQSENDDMVLVKDIEVYSLCEHHLLPFFGKCHVAYFPEGKVLGLSKVARIVDHFARRLQIQENLTRQVAEAIVTYTGAASVGVVIEAQHLCMMMRGVEKQHSSTRSSCMLGRFKTDHVVRHEFLRLLI